MLDCVTTDFSLQTVHTGSSHSWLEPWLVHTEMWPDACQVSKTWYQKENKVLVILKIATICTLIS